MPLIGRVAVIAQIVHRVVNRQAHTDRGVIKPVKAGFGEGSRIWRQVWLSEAPATLFALITWKPWLAKSRYCCAGGDVEHHQIVERMRAHPQKQRIFVARFRFIVKKGEHAAGVESLIAQQAALAARHTR